MKIGSLVECISNYSNQVIAIKCGVILPVKHKIYTVRDLVEDDDGLYLEEIVNKRYLFLSGDFCEPYFSVYDFRELVPPIQSEIEELLKKPVELI